MIYKEVYKGIREYEFDINEQDFIKWLNGKKPDKYLLEDYIVDQILPREYPYYEDEDFIDAEVEDADEFIESLNHDSE